MVLSSYDTCLEPDATVYIAMSIAAGCFIVSLFSIVMCNRWQNMQSVEGGQYLVEVEGKVEVPVSKPQSGLITKSVKDKLIL